MNYETVLQNESGAAEAELNCFGHCTGIPQSQQVHYTIEGKPTEVYEGVGMILSLISGARRIIGREDAEMLLNDGVLNQMNIPIEFLREDGDEKVGFHRKQV